jgi:hypothetical protein
MKTGHEFGMVGILIFYWNKITLRDDYNHIQVLLGYFKDSRYIKVNGKPVLLSIDQNYFLILKKTILIWREVVKKQAFLICILVLLKLMYFRGVNEDGLIFHLIFNLILPEDQLLLNDSVLKRYFYQFLKIMGIQLK